MKLNKEELQEVICCMEQMETAYESGTLEYQDYKRALIKLEDELDKITK